MKLLEWMTKTKTQMFVGGFLLCAFFVDIKAGNYLSASANLLLVCFIILNEWGKD